ncbi:MAG: hypothetical protein KJZ72_20225 [Anaerolineales bacterium]|nr:hypothetical protein [Anaerolineales bacterium]
MRDEAFKRIGHLYPPVTITNEMLAERPDLKEQGYKAGDQLTVIVWLWARTVKCPNPACGAEMPLVKSFALSTKKGKEHWVEPKIHENLYSFVVKNGGGKVPLGTVNRNGATCICCKTPVSFDYIRSEGQSGRMGTKLLAIVAEGKNRRIYLSPIGFHETHAKSVRPDWRPDTNLVGKSAVNVPLYGLKTHGDLFSDRQLNSLNTFSELVRKAFNKITQDIQKMTDRDLYKYSLAVSTYLSIAVDRSSDAWSSLASWRQGAEATRSTFSRQALAMVWDFAEANPFSQACGNWDDASISWIVKVLDQLPTSNLGTVMQKNAVDLEARDMVFSTDPPYYDNISYADLSDFFYVWMRHTMTEVSPDLFGTLLVPKSEELVATPYRFNGDKQKAELYFEEGLKSVFLKLREGVNNSYPVTVYYAFKQSEAEDSEVFESDMTEETNSRASTGWETMLSGLIQSGFEITGTWPMRTERGGRSVGIGANALASSIVLVCRPRPENASPCSRREFLGALKKELAPALRELQQGSIAPVDLAQAAIGPGMAVFSRYSSVLEADGKSMPVRTALGLINQALDEYLSEQEGEYDGDTRWALSWYEQFGHNEAAFGVAETLSKAKNTSVNGLVEAGILEARGGKVRLLGRDELDHEWDPTQDKRPTAWEAVQHLIYALENEGEESAAGLLAKLGSIAEPARDLAYRLYTVCERKGWAQDALGYNMLVVAWPRLKELAAKQKPMQENLL